MAGAVGCCPALLPAGAAAVGPTPWPPIAGVGLLLVLRVSKALTAELLLRRFRLPSGAGGRGLAANGRLWLMLRLHLPRLWLLQ